MVYFIQLASRIRMELAPSWSCSQAVSKPVWHMPLLCLQWKTPDDGQRKCPKHLEFYSLNTFEKLAHLVGIIIRIAHFISVLFCARNPYLLSAPHTQIYIYIYIYICMYDNSQTYHAQYFYSINFYLLLWSQWCLSGHYNYDKGCAANTAQPASLHLTVKALSKYFWQIQYITQESCNSNKRGRLAVIHAKHNAKTSTMNTVSHFTTNDKYQMTSEQRHDKNAVLYLSILLFPSFETPLHFSLITSTYAQYCNFCSQHQSYLAICLRDKSHKKTAQIKHLPFTVPKEYTSFCLTLSPNCESV